MFSSIIIFPLCDPLILIEWVIPFLDCLSDLDGMETDSGIEFEDLTPEPEAIDVTELITEIIDSVETPIDDITEINEGTVNNLKKNGKKRKEECK